MPIQHANTSTCSTPAFASIFHPFAKRTSPLHSSHRVQHDGVALSYIEAPTAAPGLTLHSGVFWRVLACFDVVDMPQSSSSLSSAEHGLFAPSSTALDAPWSTESAGVPLGCIAHPTAAPRAQIILHFGVFWRRSHYNLPARFPAPNKVCSLHGEQCRCTSVS